MRLSRLFILIALAACQPDVPNEPAAVVRDSAGVRIIESTSPVWPQNLAWRLEARPSLRLELSDSEPEHGPLDPVTAFRISTGEILVADGNEVGWQRLLVFASDGNFVRYIGNKGNGPCEFQQVWTAHPYLGDSIIVHDMARNTFVIAALNGECGRTLPASVAIVESTDPRSSSTPGIDGVYPDGSLLLHSPGYRRDPGRIGWTQRRHELLRVGASGVPVNSLGDFLNTDEYWNGRGPRHGVGRKSVRVLDRYDLIHGDGSTFELLRFDSTGVLKQVIRRSFLPQQLTDEVKEALVSRRVASANRGESGTRRSADLSTRISEAYWPATLPAYSDLLVDTESNLWVENYRIEDVNLLVESKSAAVWSVFDQHGRWQGDVDVPSRLFLKAIYRDEALGIWQDEDGAKSIRIYKVIKPGQGGTAGL